MPKSRAPKAKLDRPGSQNELFREAKALKIKQCREAEITKEKQEAAERLDAGFFELRQLEQSMYPPNPFQPARFDAETFLKHLRVIVRLLRDRGWTESRWKKLDYQPSLERALESVNNPDEVQNNFQLSWRTVGDALAGRMNVKRLMTVWNKSLHGCGLAHVMVLMSGCTGKGRFDYLPNGSKPTKADPAAHHTATKGSAMSIDALPDHLYDQRREVQADRAMRRAQRAQTRNHYIGLPPARMRESRNEPTGILEAERLGGPNAYRRG